MTPKLFLLLLLVLLSGCGGGGTSPAASQPADNEAMSVVPPEWARDPVGQWLNMDWDLWSCPQARNCCPWRAGGECQ